LATFVIGKGSGKGGEEGTVPVHLQIHKLAEKTRTGMGASCIKIKFMCEAIFTNVLKIIPQKIAVSSAVFYFLPTLLYYKTYENKLQYLCVYCFSFMQGIRSDPELLSGSVTDAE